MTEELLTTIEAAALLRVHPNTLRNWKKSGAVPAVDLGDTGRIIRWRKSDIEGMINNGVAS